MHRAPRRPIELFNKNGRLCLMFTDLCVEGGEAVQSNQFLIVDGDTGAIIDPGGNLACADLYLAKTSHFLPIAPQHGAPMKGAAVHEFIDWAEGLACGIDLVGQGHYTVPA